MMAFAEGKELFAKDLFGGADPTHRINVRVVTEYAWHSLFVHQLLIRPTRKSSRTSIRNSPSSTCPASMPIRRGMARPARP